MAKGKSESVIETPRRRKVEEAQSKLLNLIRASVGVIWVKCAEEMRFERQLLQMAKALDPVRRVCFWSITQGVTGPARPGVANITVMGEEAIANNAKSPVQMLEWTMANARQKPGAGQPTILVARDFHNPLREPGAGSFILTRSVRDAIRTLRSAQTKTSVLILAPTGSVPGDLTAEIGYVEWPLPDREDVGKILDVTMKNVGGAVPAPTNGERDRIVDASTGLSAEQIANAYACSIVERSRIDADAVLQSKAGEVRKLDLQYIDPDPLLKIGGLDNLRAWLQQMRACYSPKARAYGLKLPKGVFIAGVSGCGKSLAALVTAVEWAQPLVQVDMTAMLGKYVGESEEKTARILMNLSAMAPCIALFDEVEKVFAGMGSGGAASDGGVKKGVFGQFLTWMQRQTGVFVMATANDVQELVSAAPEFVRKGRFDELFFVDLPITRERAEIAAIHLGNTGRDLGKFDVDAIAKASMQLSGAEIEAAVAAAMRFAFADDGREFTTEDVVRACKNTVPLARTSAGTINSLRQWAKGRCVMATPPEEDPVSIDIESEIGARVLDLPVLVPTKGGDLPS